MGYIFINFKTLIYFNILCLNIVMFHRSILEGIIYILFRRVVPMTKGHLHVLHWFNFEITIYFNKYLQDKGPHSLCISRITRADINVYIKLYVERRYAFFLHYTSENTMHVENIIWLFISYIILRKKKRNICLKFEPSNTGILLCFHIARMLGYL